MSGRVIQIMALLIASSTSYALDRDASLAEQVRMAARQHMLAAIPSDKRIVVRATPPVKHRVTVFTDTDCPFCRKFHQQVEDYARAGIEVQYMFYPRAGLDSPAYAGAVAVWCSGDRQASLALALNGDTFPSRTCDNPVAEHYELALRLGLLGTPALVTEEGAVMYGVVSTSRLLERLNTLSDARPTPRSAVARGR